MPIYKANSRYNSSLTSGYTHSPADTTLNVGSVPSNLPTIVVVARDTVKETWFTATGSSGGNQLTGVSRLRGANVSIDAGASVECVNSPEFLNQYADAVINPADLKDLVYAADGGSNDTYAITLPVAPTAYSDLTGLPIAFMANTVNTGPATLNVNTLGAKTIKKNKDEDLEDGDIKAGQIVLVAYDGTNFQMLGGVGGEVGSSFWETMPGTPTRVSDTQFTISDAANANNYDKLFKKGVILKWEESSTFQTAMIISSSYSSNVVTINIVGSSLTAGFSLMKYCSQMARKERFIIPGVLAAATDASHTFFPEDDIYPLSVDARDKVAGTTNATVFDINDDGSTIISTKPSIASGATSDIDNVVTDPTTPIAKDSAVTADVDSVSTTPPEEGYLDLFYYPVSWRYRT